MRLIIYEFFDSFVVIMIFDENVYALSVLNVSTFLKTVDNKKVTSRYTSLFVDI